MGCSQCVNSSLVITDFSVEAIIPNIRPGQPKEQINPIQEQFEGLFQSLDVNPLKRSLVGFEETKCILVGWKLY